MIFIFYQDQFKSIYSIRKSIKGDGSCHLSYDPKDTPSIAKITLFERSNIIGIFNIFIYATNNSDIKITNMKLPKNIYFSKGTKLLIKLNITEQEIVFSTNILEDDISVMKMIENEKTEVKKTTFIERWTKENINDICVEYTYENIYIASYILPISVFKDFINVFNIDNVIDVFIKKNKIIFKTFLVLENNMIKKLECVQPLIDQTEVEETFSFNGLSLANLKNIITFTIFEDEKLFKDIRVDVYKNKSQKYVLIFKPANEKIISLDKDNYLFNIGNAVKMFIVQN